MINIQPIEKMTQERETLDVHSIFYTIQGEGPFKGCPAVFVRLAGCNLQCPGCDTDYTSTRRRIRVLDLIREIRKKFEDNHIEGVNRLVVITGGEPLRQKRALAYLLGRLQFLFTVQIETNGTTELPVQDAHGTHMFYGKLYPALNGNIHVVCSPKTPRIHESVMKHACALKYVLKDGQVSEEDGLPTTVLENNTGKPVQRPAKNFSRLIYVQPMDEKDDKLNEANLKAAIKSSMKFGYRLQLQIHKLINME